MFSSYIISLGLGLQFWEMGLIMTLNSNCWEDYPSSENLTVYHTSECVCVCVCVCVCACMHAYGHSVVSDCLQSHELWPARLFFMEFSRPEYWSGLSFPTPGNGVGIFPTEESNLSLLHLLHWQVDSLPLFHLLSATYVCSKAVLRL